MNQSSLINTIKVIKQNDSNYPLSLKEIPNPPEKLYILGDLPNDPPAGGPKIAIVGTRKATNYGERLAEFWAEKLAEMGAVIVSGLAMGIDSAAHRGALKAKGKTIAVLGNGLNEIYPAQNENLAEKILKNQGGAIISEYPAGTPSFRSNFLERNRIISGLSIATIIIEAPEKSGALVTARLAAEQGREVFVVPGPINHPNYKGSHKLIRDGARLVTSMEDILEDLNINLKSQKLNLKNTNQISNLKNVDESQLLVIKTIQEAGQPLNIDKIIQLTKLEPQIVNQSLAVLIIQGIIKETECGYSL